MAEVRRLRKVEQRVRLPMQGLQLPDAPVLCHADDGGSVPGSPAPAEAAAGGELDERRQRGCGDVRGVQQEEIGKDVSVHRVRIPSPCGVRQGFHQRPPSQRHTYAREA